MKQAGGMAGDGYLGAAVGLGAWVRYLLDWTALLSGRACLRIHPSEAASTATASQFGEPLARLGTCATFWRGGGLRERPGGRITGESVEGIHSPKTCPLGSAGATSRN